MLRVSCSCSASHHQCLIDLVRFGLLSYRGRGLSLAPSAPDLHRRFGTLGESVFLARARCSAALLRRLGALHLQPLSQSAYLHPSSTRSRSATTLFWSWHISPVKTENQPSPLHAFYGPRTTQCCSTDCSRVSRVRAAGRRSRERWQPCCQLQLGATLQRTAFTRMQRLLHAGQPAAHSLDAPLLSSRVHLQLQRASLR